VPVRSKTASAFRQTNYCVGQQPLLSIATAPNTPVFLLRHPCPALPKPYTTITARSSPTSQAHATTSPTRQLWLRRQLRHSVDEIWAARAVETSAAIQEAFIAVLATQAASGKGATSDYSLSRHIIFDSGATTTMLPATTPLDKRTPASVRIFLANGTPVYATRRGVLTLPTKSGARCS
jgi:hypothetical protein